MTYLEVRNNKKNNNFAFDRFRVGGKPLRNGGLLKTRKLAGDPGAETHYPNKFVANQEKKSKLPIYPRSGFFPVKTAHLGTTQTD
jgi:hypothetical protein